MRVSACRVSYLTQLMYGFTLYMRYVTTYKPEAEHSHRHTAVQLTRTGHPTVPLPAARQIVHKARRPRAIMEPRESAPAWSLCRKQCRVSLGYTAFVPRSTIMAHTDRHETRTEATEIAGLYRTLQLRSVRSCLASLQISTTNKPSLLCMQARSWS